MRRISLRVPEELYDGFEALAEREKRPVADLVREAIRTVLDEERRRRSAREKP